MKTAATDFPKLGDRSPEAQLFWARRLLEETQTRLDVILELIGVAPPFDTHEDQLVSRVALDAISEIVRHLDEGCGASATSPAETEVRQ